MTSAFESSTLRAKVSFTSLHKANTSRCSSRRFGNNLLERRSSFGEKSGEWNSHVLLPRFPCTILEVVHDAARVTCFFTCSACSRHQLICNVPPCIFGRSWAGCAKFWFCAPQRASIVPAPTGKTLPTRTERSKDYPLPPLSVPTAAVELCLCVSPYVEHSVPLVTDSHNRCADTAKTLTDGAATPPAAGPTAGEGGPTSDSALGSSSAGPASVEAAVRIVKDVDGMINRLPAARGSKGPTDGELSALEEEVRWVSAVLTNKEPAVTTIKSCCSRDTTDLQFSCSTTCFSILSRSFGGVAR